MCGERKHGRTDKYQRTPFLLVVRLIDGRLRLYRVKIDWGLKGPKSNLHPSLTFDHLVAIGQFCTDVEILPAPDMLTRVPSETHLSHLEFLPQSKSTDLLPTILAVFSYSPNQLNPTNTIGGLPYSIICRWECVPADSSISPAFGSASKPGYTTKPPSAMVSDEAGGHESFRPNMIQGEYQLKRLEDVQIDDLVLSVQMLASDTLLRFGYSSGRVELRDRATLRTLPLATHDRMVPSLPEMGLCFHPTQPCMTFSYWHTCLTRARLVQCNLSQWLDTCNFWEGLRSTALRSANSC